MKLLLASLLLFLIPLASSADEPRYRCYELRTYHAAEGKLEALHARFRDHTLGLFEKHGMKNLYYWMPEANEGQTLVYLLAYPDRDARESSWKAFLADPDWQAAKAESEKDGKLVAKVESRLLHPTDYSPQAVEWDNTTPHLFEMRVYRTLPGRLAALDDRFRQHTVKLFTQHGMTNLIYFHLDEDQEGADSTLVYFLAHASHEAQAASFQAFRSDPAWIAVREASEKDGKIVVENGVTSTLLLATDYSPVK
ncbi:MAG TPA: NIPSNAP family protein [Bacteroidia bacterium]|nr:NIPSNAP family protein [Bacteroidia bacterium]